MRSLELDEKQAKKLSDLPVTYYKSEFSESLKSFFPGEWILFRDPIRKKIYLGFINPIVADSFPVINILMHVEKMPTARIVEDYLDLTIKKAIEYRLRFQGYENSSRIIYGDADGLPGLVVDLYTNVCLIQINSAGIDKHRELVKETISKYTKVQTYILEGAKQRTQEMLPMYREKIDVDTIVVSENEFRYNLGIDKIQKNGWYFDHRENRQKLENLIRKLNIPKKDGLDLFCYQGAWGFHILRAGCEKVDLIDQADMGEMILANAKVNKLNNLTFKRMDVFKWLDESIKEKKKYNIIVSDPPAFAKKKIEKKSAIDGYVKLHKK